MYMYIFIYLLKEHVALLWTELKYTAIVKDWNVSMD